MQRRKKGSGGISRRPNGSWMGQASLRSNGVRRRVTVYAPTEAAAEAKLREALPHLAENTGVYADRRSSVMAEARRLGQHTAGEWYAKVRAYDNRCHYCGVRVLRGLTKDHLTPVSRGGSDGIDNIVPCCKPCNSFKWDMTEAEFALLRPVVGRRA